MRTYKVTIIANIPAEAVVEIGGENEEEAWNRALYVADILNGSTGTPEERTALRKSLGFEPMGDAIGDFEVVEIEYEVTKP